MTGESKKRLRYGDAFFVIKKQIKDCLSTLRSDKQFHFGIKRNVTEFYRFQKYLLFL
jgi:hypothetical protein